MNFQYFELTAITCPTVDIANAVRFPHKDSYDYNDDVTYTCATGYKPDDIASMTRTCSDSGWSGAEPACTGMVNGSGSDQILFDIIQRSLKYQIS